VADCFLIGVNLKVLRRKPAQFSIDVEFEDQPIYSLYLNKQRSIMCLLVMACYPARGNIIDNRGVTVIAREDHYAAKVLKECARPAVR
jgi:hypothetical protein